MSHSVNDISAWILQCHDQLVGKKCVKCRSVYPSDENLMTRSIFVKQHWLFKDRSSNQQGEEANINAEIDDAGSYVSDENSYESDDNTGNGFDDDGDSNDTAVQSPEYRPASPYNEDLEEEAHVEDIVDRAVDAVDIGMVSDVNCDIYSNNVVAKTSSHGVPLSVSEGDDETAKVEQCRKMGGTAQEIQSVVIDVSSNVKCDICFNMRKRGGIFNKTTCRCNVGICLPCSIEIVNCPFCRLNMRPHVKGTVDLKVKFSDLIVLTRSPYYTDSLRGVTDFVGAAVFGSYVASGASVQNTVDLSAPVSANSERVGPVVGEASRAEVDAARDGGSFSRVVEVNEGEMESSSDSASDSDCDSDSDSDEENGGPGVPRFASSRENRFDSHGERMFQEDTSVSDRRRDVQPTVVLLHYNGNIVRTHIPSLLPQLETETQFKRRLSLDPRVVRETLRGDLLVDVSQTMASMWVKLAYASAAVIYSWEGTGVDDRGNLSVSMPVQLLQDLFQFFTRGMRALITLNKLKRHLTIVKLAYIICITLRKAMRVNRTRLTFAENLNWLEENDVLNEAMSMLRKAKRHSTSYERLKTVW